MTIIAAINAGISIYKSVAPAFGGGVLPEKDLAIANAGAAIVSTAVNLYGTVKADLSLTDQKSVDDALAAEDVQLALDFAKLHADIGVVQ